MQLFSLFLHLLSRKQPMGIGKEKVWSTEELAQRSLQNDSTAQRLLYERLAGKMLAVCNRYVGNRECAKDVMQDAFIVLFEKLGSYTGTGSFEGWARKIFVNTALMYLRKSDALRFSEPVEGLKMVPSTHYSELDKLSAHDLMTCIASMPPGFRAVFNLFAIEGYPHEEIAQMLRISESTSRSQYVRAREWLQQRLKNYK